ncbi:hypothetical protein PUMCH_004996 [Australozyma saopauloensis]|uniref:COMPASS component SDC1 n=1 Tax=Australozyma saopauloensis TaxID=291208 RepID=A0AAX4HHQ1_9ASCO|nr:hypothetical protein PUMCH_004996 [[Candida] saopauloensis]
MSDTVKFEESVSDVKTEDENSLQNTASKSITEASGSQSSTILEPESGESKTRKASEENTPQPKKSKTANTPPVHEMVGGLSVRQYLNKNLTEHLLEGLREISRNQPEDPLRELGLLLIKKSDQLKLAQS